MPFRWNPITSNFDLTDQPPAGTGDVFHADPLTNNKVVLGAGTDFIKVSGIEVDASDNMSLVNTLSVIDIATTQQNLDLEPGVDVQVWSAILDQLALLSPTAGDVIYADGDPKWTVLPKGADGEVLKLVGGFPSWEPDATGGDVVGPASAVDGNLASYDGVTGKLIQDSGIATSEVLVDGDIGVNVQAYSAILDQFAALTPTAGDLIFSNGTPEWTQLAVSDEGKKLVIASGLPAWVDDNPNNLLRGFTNLGLFYSAGVMTIKGANGDDLSIDNPAYVTLNSNVNSGEVVTYKLTSNYTFNDTSAGTDLNGALWGTTTSVAWGEAMPIFIYFVSKNDDSSCIPCLSRKFWDLTVCGSGKMTVKGSSNPVNEEDFFSVVSGVTAGDFENTNTILVGYFTATKNSSNNWSFFSPSATLEGFGRYPYQRLFLFPTGQNGAVIGSHLSSSNGGDTIPIFNTISYAYDLDRSGKLNAFWNAATVTSSGVGSGNIRFHIPYSVGPGQTRISRGTYVMQDNPSGLWITATPRLTSLSSPLSYFEVVLDGNGTENIKPQDFTTNISVPCFNVLVRAMFAG